MAKYCNRFASIEVVNPDKTFSVFNDVTGMMIKDRVGYWDAFKAMRELGAHYEALEKGKEF